MKEKNIWKYKNWLLFVKNLYHVKKNKVFNSFNENNKTPLVDIFIYMPLALSFNISPNY